MHNIAIPSAFLTCRAAATPPVAARPRHAARYYHRRRLLESLLRGLLYVVILALLTAGFVWGMRTASFAEELTVHSYGFPEEYTEEPAAAYSPSQWQFVHDYAKRVNRHVDAALVATDICSGWEKARLEFGCKDVPLEMLLPFAKRESTFRRSVVNGCGCTGYLQLMRRYHKRPLENLGLCWDEPSHLVCYAVVHVQSDIDRGKSLKQACGWWQVRDRGAWAEWKRIEAALGGTA